MRIIAKNTETKKRNYLAHAGGAILLIVIVQAYWPGTIPFNTFAPWHSVGSVDQWLAVGWPLLAWGVVGTVLLSFFRPSTRYYNEPWKIFKVGLGISLWAGVVEEIAFRWLIFFASIVGVKILNFLVFDFAGFGLPHWWHIHILGPLADYATLGKLSGWLTNSEYWTIGAAMISTTALFRDGHTYQGWIGWLNSWFLGMVFFWFMFTFGLPSAILLHFLYDYVIFVTFAGVVAIRR